MNKESDQATYDLENEKDEVKIYESERYISNSRGCMAYTWVSHKWTISYSIPPSGTLTQWTALLKMYYIVKPLLTTYGAITHLKGGKKELILKDTLAWRKIKL